MIALGILQGAAKELDVLDQLELHQPLRVDAAGAGVKAEPLAPPLEALGEQVLHQVLQRLLHDAVLLIHAENGQAGQAPEQADEAVVAEPGRPDVQLEHPGSLLGHDLQHETFELGGGLEVPVESADGDVGAGDVQTAEVGRRDVVLGLGAQLYSSESEIL